MCNISYGFRLGIIHKLCLQERPKKLTFLNGVAGQKSRKLVIASIPDLEQSHLYEIFPNVFWADFWQSKNN